MEVDAVPLTRDQGWVELGNAFAKLLQDEAYKKCPQERQQLEMKYLKDASAHMRAPKSPESDPWTEICTTWNFPQRYEYFGEEVMEVMSRIPCKDMQVFAWNRLLENAAQYQAPSEALRTVMESLVTFGNEKKANGESPWECNFENLDNIIQENIKGILTRAYKEFHEHKQDVWGQIHNYFEAAGACQADLDRYREYSTSKLPPDPWYYFYPSENAPSPWQYALEASGTAPPADLTNLQDLLGKARPNADFSPSGAPSENTKPAAKPSPTMKEKTKATALVAKKKTTTKDKNKAKKKNTTKDKNKMALTPGKGNAKRKLHPKPPPRATNTPGGPKPPPPSVPRKTQVLVTKKATPLGPTSKLPVPPMDRSKLSSPISDELSLASDEWSLAVVAPEVHLRFLQRNRVELIEGFLVEVYFDPEKRSQGLIKLRKALMETNDSAMEVTAMYGNELDIDIILHLPEIWEFDLDPYCKLEFLGELWKCFGISFTGLSSEAHGVEQDARDLLLVKLCNVFAVQHSQVFRIVYQEKIAEGKADYFSFLSVRDDPKWKLDENTVHELPEDSYFKTTGELPRFTKVQRLFQVVFAGVVKMHIKEKLAKQMEELSSYHSLLESELFKSL
jgi:hypothetical protein